MRHRANGCTAGSPCWNVIGSCLLARPSHAPYTSWLGKIHLESPPLEFHAISRTDSVVHAVVIHFHESEPPRFSRITITDQFHGKYVAVPRKQLAQLVRGGIEGNIAYVNRFHCYCQPPGRCPCTGRMRRYPVSVLFRPDRATSPRLLRPASMPVFPVQENSPRGTDKKKYSPCAAGVKAALQRLFSARPTPLY